LQTLINYRELAVYGIQARRVVKKKMLDYAVIRVKLRIGLAASTYRRRRQYFQKDFPSLGFMQLPWEASSRTSE
jgi:hypothetical protein